MPMKINLKIQTPTKFSTAGGKLSFVGVILSIFRHYLLYDLAMILIVDLSTNSLNIISSIL